MEVPRDKATFPGWPVCGEARIQAQAVKLNKNSKKEKGEKRKGKKLKTCKLEEKL